MSDAPSIAEAAAQAAEPRLPDHQDFGPADDAAFKAMCRRNAKWLRDELQWAAAGYTPDQRADVNP